MTDTDALIDGTFMPDVMDNIISAAGMNVLGENEIHGCCVPPRLLQCYGDSPTATLEMARQWKERGARLVPSHIYPVPKCACSGCERNAAYIFQNRGDNMHTLAVCHNCFFGQVSGSEDDDIFSSASPACQKLATEILGAKLSPEMNISSTLRMSGHIFCGFAVLPASVSGVKTISDVSLVIRRVDSHELSRVPISRHAFELEEGKLFLSAYYDINNGGNRLEGVSEEEVRQAACSAKKSFKLKENYAYLFSSRPVLGQTMVDKVVKGGARKQVPQSNFVSKGIHKAHIVIQHDARGRLVQQQLYYIQMECTVQTTDDKMHRIFFATSEDDKTQITTTTRRICFKSKKDNGKRKHASPPQVEIDDTASPFPNSKRQCVTPPALSLTKSTVEDEFNRKELEDLRVENTRLTKEVANLHEKTGTFQRQNVELIQKLEAQERLIKELRNTMVAMEEKADPMDML